MEQTQTPHYDVQDEYEQVVLTDLEERKRITDPSEEDIEQPFTYSISSYGADYDVEGLVRRMRNGDIVVPEFQRKYVWTQARASRFIESLLLGLPVPGIFLAVDPETRQLLVIDGQQRLRSLRHFYEETFPRKSPATGTQDSHVSTVPFVLKGERNKPINPEFEGKTYSTLSPSDRRRLDNSIIHATVIKQDAPQEEDSSSIYYIFERLNTGGVSLQPQEIRTSIYQGAFQKLLQQLNEYPQWREIFGPVNQRMKDQEMILRFFALYYDREKYRKPLLAFLNAYMSSNRDLQRHTETQLVQLFTNTIDTVYQCLGKSAFRPARTFNAAVYDAVMYGIAKRLGRGAITNCNQLRTQYELLLQNEEFVRLYNAGTTDEANIRQRLELTTKAFEDVL